MKNGEKSPYDSGREREKYHFEIHLECSVLLKVLPSRKSALPECKQCGVLSEPN